MSNVDGVHRAYVRAGYRAPKGDHGRGGNNKTDIYLRDVGGQGLYGYCTSDAKYFPSASNHSLYAFCVLDNDYRSAQFPTNTPIENMQVTAAHEYFHAVQYAYDVLEDGWFMEATATWAEDELYDRVNDNLQYLDQSPLTQPSTPLDFFNRYGLNQYGDWIFFRYLTEGFPKTSGGMPVLLRKIWESADSVGRGKDRYSVQAIQRALDAKGTSLRDQFAGFSAANLFSRTAYAEGTALAYPQAKPVKKIGLGAGGTSSPSLRPLDHLTAGTVRFTTKASAAPGSTLQVVVNMPDTVRGSAAVVSVNYADGTHDQALVVLDDTGAGSATPVGFGNALVTSVDVTLVNASLRFDCHQGTNFSCRGKSQDDGLTGKITATVGNP
jgi:hypothetical protein